MSVIIFEFDTKDVLCIAMQYQSIKRAIAPSMGDIKPVIGHWEGVTSQSFIMDEVEFNRLVRNSGMVDKQECFMHVTSCNKAYASLEYQDGLSIALGSMHQVSMEQAMRSDGWTYRPDLDVWWVAAHGNPDLRDVTSILDTIVGEVMHHAA